MTLTKTARALKTAIKITEIFPAYQDYLQPARIKVAHGGRGSAKTRTFVTILKNNVLYFGWRVVCFREFMKSIADSVYQEFVDEISRCGEDSYFEILRGEIRCKHSGGVIKFDGLKGNEQKVKGYSGFDAAFVEEAENVSEESWKMLIPTLRKEGSEIWVAYNPDDPLSATHKKFVTERQYPDYILDQKTGLEKRYCIVKQINYTENPRFPEELRIDMEIMKENDYEMYRHVYLGEPVGNSNLAIIKPVWVQAAMDSFERLGIIASGELFGGFDVADEGPDFNAEVYQKQGELKFINEWKDQDPNTAARRVYGNAYKNRVHTVHYDTIGVGAGAKGAIREQIETDLQHVKVRIPNFVGFTANASVYAPTEEYAEGKTNKDMFANIKAQTWWLVADRFKNTYDALNGKPFDPDKLICIPSALPLGLRNKLMFELAQPRREFVSGKFRVESKERMKKRGVRSPNLADAFIMSFSPLSAESEFNKHLT
jgi:phage terminase large subunit